MTTTFNMFNWVAVSSDQIASGFEFSLVFWVRKNGFIVTFRRMLTMICRCTNTTSNMYRRRMGETIEFYVAFLSTPKHYQARSDSSNFVKRYSGKRG